MTSSICVVGKLLPVSEHKTGQATTTKEIKGKIRAKFARWHTKQLHNLTEKLRLFYKFINFIRNTIENYIIY